MAIPIHDPQTTGFPYTTRVFGNDPPPSQCPEPIAIVGMGKPIWISQRQFFTSLLPEAQISELGSCIM